MKPASQWLVTIAVEITINAPTYTEIPVIAPTRSAAALAITQHDMTRGAFTIEPRETTTTA